MLGRFLLSLVSRQTQEEPAAAPPRQPELPSSSPASAASVGEGWEPPPRSRPGHSCSSDSHLRGHWPGDGVARPGLLGLTSYFQRFGNR